MEKSKYSPTKVYRTPDERFVNLPGYPFAPRYVEVAGYRMHYVEEGPLDAAPVLLLHGEPTWSYLYRKMIPILAPAGNRVLAPDLIGFGRSDKPTLRENYSYAGHVAWMAEWMERLDLHDITLVVQDWGSLIGLRLLAEHPERFSRVVVANGFLPTGEGSPSSAFRLWQTFARWTPVFPVSRIVQLGCASKLSREVRAAYDAPFPNRPSKAGARAFPLLVPTTFEDPASAANIAAWETLRAWEKPFLTAFATDDPIFGKLDRVLQEQIPGAKGQPHTRIRGAGHFIQEDKGEELAEVVLDFIEKTSKPAP
jgi:haloalkane dehalogenase